MNSQIDIRNHLRACAIIRDRGGSIMLFKERDDDYWILPGGKVEAVEDFEQACRREIEEELGVGVSATKFGFMFENRFTLKDRPVREISVCFRVVLDSFAFESEIGLKRQLRFLGPNDISGTHIKPYGLKALLLLEFDGSSSEQYYSLRDQEAV